MRRPPNSRLPADVAAIPVLVRGGAHGAGGGGGGAGERALHLRPGIQVRRCIYYRDSIAFPISRLFSSLE